MKLKIKVTKQILKKSMMCAVKSIHEVSENCAIALAVREIFSNARVSNEHIVIWRNTEDQFPLYCIDLPIEAKFFITIFDGLRSKPLKRLDLPEFEFEVDLSQELIDKINIDEIKSILAKSETLELIES